MTRSSIRHAIFERAPAAREDIVTTVAAELGTAEAVIDDTVDRLEARGEVYLADGEVRETGGGA
jgi:hypothetical protein